MPDRSARELVGATSPKVPNCPTFPAIWGILTRPLSGADRLPIVMRWRAYVWAPSCWTVLIRNV